MKKGAENEEISIDIDTGEEVEMEQEEVTNSALKGKLKKLRDELKEAKKERDENLAGWQRSKADLVNYRKNVGNEAQRNNLRAKGAIVKSIIPAIDSFDTAMNDKSWNDVEKSWKEGIERIANQFHKALELEGLESFGKEGDEFNPEIHECMSVAETNKKKDDHKIIQVLQRGYKIDTELVRPAKVVVSQLKK